MSNRGRPKKVDTVIETQKTINQDQNNESLQAFASIDPFQQTYFEMNYPSPMSTFASYTIPTSQIDMIRKAKELREYDIVDYFLRLRCDYGLPIQAIKCSKPSQQKFYDKYVLPLVQDFARQFEYEYWSTSEVFGHYGFTKDKKPMYLVTEDPESVVPNAALGIESYEIKISTTLKQQLNKLKDQNQLDRLPDYLQNAIGEKGQIKDKVVLTNKNMARICNQKVDYQLRPKPILLKIAKSLMLREFLIDVDFANSFASQKSSITHIQCGNEQTLTQWDATKIKAMLDLVVQRAPGNLFVSTRGDVKISPVNMDLSQMFDPKRFEECNKRILNFFGISAAYMPSESGGINNSTVIVSTKGFEESLKNDRKVFEKFLSIYFQEVNRLNSFNELPTIIYKHTNIRDNNELLKELQFLSERGVLSFEKLCLEFNYDYDEVMKQKKNDWENRDWQAQTVELSQGTSPMLQEKFEQELKLKETSKNNQNNLNNQNNKVQT